MFILQWSVSLKSFDYTSFGKITELASTMHIYLERTEVIYLATLLHIQILLKLENIKVK